MALTRCKECGREISESAASCPHCGYKTELGSLEAKNKPLRIKQWIYTGIFLLGLILFVTNVGTLADRYEEWEIADGFIRDIWGSTKVTFMEYLGEYDERGVFWATIIGPIMTLWGAVGALVNRGRYKRNKIETMNEKILYGSDARGSGQGEIRWICAACGQVNLKRVAYCQSCGAAQSWSEAQSNKDSVEQKPATCPQCGTLLKSGDAFCMRCGTKIDK